MKRSGLVMRVEASTISAIFDKLLRGGGQNYAKVPKEPKLYGSLRVLPP